MDSHIVAEMSEPSAREQELRETLKRCSEATVHAALEYQKEPRVELIPTIVFGIVERFVDPEVRPRLAEGDQIRLMEDLGIDSLLMVEIVMTTEEVLNLTIENEELAHLRSLGDVKRYLAAKSRGEAPAAATQAYTAEQILACMPQQPPFLFLQEARVESDGAVGIYRISGQEAFLEGHFRGNPIFPASLMLEALGQLAVFYLLKTTDEALRAQVDPTNIYFLSADGVRCQRLCRPTDTLELSVKLQRVHAPLAQFSGQIRCQGARAAKVDELSLSMAAFPRPDSPESA